MKIICSFIFVSVFALAVSSSVSAQVVSTLVSGPSSFDDGLALDANGNIYASYYFGRTVSKITPAGQVSAFASGFDNPNQITFAENGDLFVPNALGNRVNRVTPSGQISTAIQSITNPSGLVFDKEGNLYIAQYQISRVSKMDTSGNITTFMSGNGLNGPVGIQIDGEGNFYFGNFNDGKIIKRTSAGLVSVIGDIPGNLGSITLTGDVIYGTAFQGNQIYRVSVDGAGQSVFAGTGVAGQNDGNVSSATFNGPNGIVATPSGDTIYITDFNARSLRVISGLPTSVREREADIELPNRFELAQNYPNPFNPTISIQYNISATSVITLKVYDITGREVATLVDEKKAPGSYQITFDSRNLASGLYFYRLVARDFSQTRRMALIR